MTKLFLSLYRYFKSHKAVFYTILISTTLVFGWFAAKIHFEENILTLLPKTDKSKKSAVAFGNIKVKDKIFVEVQCTYGKATPEELAAVMDSFLARLQEKDKDTLVGNVLSTIDTDDLMNLVYYGMDALPCHLGPEAYPLIDSLLTEETIDEVAAGDIPIGLPQMGSFKIIGSHLFSADSTLALAFISPSFDAIETMKGNRLEDIMSEAANDIRRNDPRFEVLYHGITVTGTFNSRRIKTDLALTVGISLLLICLIICLCFKTKGTLPMLLSPVIYGTLFSLSCLYWMKGTVSLMAMGIGAIVLGVALSYCLHVLVHHKFVADPETVVREQARPVCLGCITTIGAFAGLLFTSSDLLKDFGIFASLALIGTTFFVLAFLPQFFTGGEPVRNDKAFRIINKINSYPLDRNKVVVTFLVIVSIVCIFASRKVKFDNDLNNIGYIEPKVAKSEQLYDAKVNQGHYNVYYATCASELDSAIMYNRVLDEVLDSVKKAGLIYSYSGSFGLLVPEEEQRANIRRWKNYWTPDKIERTESLLGKKAKEYDWGSTGFDIPGTFRLMAEADYDPQSVYDAGVIPEALMCNYVEHNEDGWLVLTSALMDKEKYFEINDIITRTDHTIVVDPFYYTGDMVEIIHQDFSTVLLISSIFVFLVLLLSFKSLTVSAIAFLPMMLSWYIVQGVMAIFNLEFNLLNIMISTFIFGIGVDYSIFVMEGLLNKARNGSSRLLICHKAAITFSGFTLIVVIASLLFAKHPAIFSIGVTTLVGMISTILITYALQPLLFKLVLKSDLLRRESLHTK